MDALIPKWHRELVLERSGITGEVDEHTDLRSARCRMKVVAVKYAEAIASLRQRPRPGIPPELVGGHL